MEDFILLRTQSGIEEGKLLLDVFGKLSRAARDYWGIIPGVEPQFLHETSKEPVKEGDWFQVNGGVSVWKVTGVEDNTVNSHGAMLASSQCTKLIASTNSLLGLPPIPEETIQAFIQWYNSK